MFYAVALVVLAALSFGYPASAATFNFDTTPEGNTIPFSLTDSGVTATFSSPDGPVFFVVTAFFQTLPNRVLLDGDPASHELDITFNQSLANISLVFALNGTAQSTFTLRAFSGGLSGVQVGTVTASGITATDFPEGSTNFGGMFDAVKLTSSAPNFAIDLVNVTTQIPEPASLGMLGLAAALGAALTRMKLSQDGATNLESQ